jgi:hypothetical protein
MEIEVIYHSVAVEGLSEKAILELVTEAQSFNKTKSITGCLLFYRNEFVQALEGDEIVVNGLLSKIEKDLRHNEMHILFKGRCEKRSYAGWNMAYDALTNNDIKKLESVIGMADFTALHMLKDSPSRVKKIFSYLSKELENSSDT